MKKFRAALSVMLLCMCCGTGCVTRQLWQGTEHQVGSAPHFTVSSDGGDVLVSYQEKRVQPFRELEPVPRSYWLSASTNRADNSAPKFIQETDRPHSTTLPVIRLDTEQENVVVPMNGVRATFYRSLTERAEQRWLIEGTNANCVAVGTNVFGEQLYVSDSAPTNTCFWRLTAKPPRYIWTTNNAASAECVVVCGDQFALWRKRETAGPFRLPHYVTHAPPNAARVLLTPLTATVDAALWSPVLAVLLVGAGGGIPR